MKRLAPFVPCPAPRPRVAARLLSALVLCTVALGCADKQPTPASSSSRDDAFAAGANRKPTPQTLYAMSRILASQGRDADSRAVLERVIRQWPQFLPAYSSLAECQMRARHVDEAIATLSAGLKVSPGDPVLLNDMGMCHLVKQEFTKALERFTAAAAAAPGDARYRANMATALGLMGRYVESLALYRQVLSAADAHYNLAVLCRARNDTVRAAEEFRVAESLRPPPAAGESRPPSAGPSRGTDGIANR